LKELTGLLRSCLRVFGLIVTLASEQKLRDEAGQFSWQRGKDKSAEGGDEQYEVPGDALRSGTILATVECLQKESRLESVTRRRATREVETTQRTDSSPLRIG
jgi:hypothetical protein